MTDVVMVLFFSLTNGGYMIIVADVIMRSTLMALSFLFIVSIFFYKMIIPRRYLVSGKKTAYATLYFRGHYDFIEIYTVKMGSRMNIKCMNKTGDVRSADFKIPSSYKSPYDYILSGSLDKQLIELRLIAEQRSNRNRAEFYKDHKLSTLHANGELDIRFHTLSREELRLF